MTVLPDWLLNEDASGLPIRALRLGEAGIEKSINLGVRRGEETISYIDGFLKLASEIGGSSAA
ncbi:hypothetical protein [Sinorhizobium psoraleae]|uniref:hypothetical protein n=1 Tax=Sinorhizobium psoraleae TaxID=520838 RepID=UPI00289FEC4A|nr:hypothetical protein [Sinorhizobium psoraleae]